MAGKIVIAGGSGFIGRSITRNFLETGHEVVTLSRSNRGEQGSRIVRWSATGIGDWVSELEGAKAIINLAGETIGQKWTLDARRRILGSRLDSTRTVGEALQQLETPPEVWINGSAVGYYGSRGDEVLDEDSPPGHGDFLSEVCQRWEATATSFDLPRTRLVIMRTGLVLAKDGGALPPLISSAILFLGGTAGSGDQYMSWIHKEDLVRLYHSAIELQILGPVNATSPHPVTNREFMETLRRKLNRPWAPPIPPVAFKIVNFFGAPDPFLLLGGQRVLPRRALAHGFCFYHPMLDETLESLLKR